MKYRSERSNFLLTSNCLITVFELSRDVKSENSGRMQSSLEYTLFPYASSEIMYQFLYQFVAHSNSPTWQIIRETAQVLQACITLHLVKRTADSVNETVFPDKLMVAQLRLWTQKVHYCVQKSPLLVPTLTLNPVHTLISHFIKIDFNTCHIYV
jgi:hypothetical protein